MKPQFAAVAAVVAGIAIGASLVQVLHAQTKPPAYVVIAVQSVTDAEAMKTVAQRASPEVLAISGGRYIVRTNEITGLEGTPPKRLVIIAFDNLEKARAWQDSPGAKETAAMRARAAGSVSFMVEGVANSIPR